MLWKCGHKDKEDMLGAVRQGEIRRILMLRCQKIGDMLTFLPVILGVRHLFPEAKITLVCREEGLGIASRIPFVDIIKLDDINRLKRTEPYDLLIASSQDAGRVKFKKQYKIKYAIGVLPESLKGICLKHRWQYRYFTTTYRYSKDDHEVYRNMKLLALLGKGNAEHDNRTLWITDDERKKALSLVPDSKGPLIVISPSGSKESQNWPADRFASLCDRLVRGKGAQIIIAGKGHLAERQTDIMLTEMKEPALSIVNKTGIGEYSALLEMADLLISVDSGTAHLASYLNRPLVVLFGPGDYNKWKPWHPKQNRAKALKVYCECGTTNVKCFAKEHCLNKIQTEQVYTEALSMLDRIKDRA